MRGFQASSPCTNYRIWFEERRNLENFILQTLDAYGLLEVALDRADEIAWSVDGADLTNLCKNTSLG